MENKNRFANAALVLGIVSIMTCCSRLQDISQRSLQLYLA